MLNNHLSPFPKHLNVVLNKPSNSNMPVYQVKAMLLKSNVAHFQCKNTEVWKS